MVLGFWVIISCFILVNPFSCVYDHFTSCLCVFCILCMCVFPSVIYSFVPLVFGEFNFLCLQLLVL